MAKINSVRMKKKTVEKQELEKKGLPTQLADMNWTAKENDNATQKIEKYKDAVKRILQKMTKDLSPNEKLTFAETENIGSLYKLQITPVNPHENQDYYHYLQRLTTRTSKDIYAPPQQAEIAEISYVYQGKTYTGYTLLNNGIKKTFHFSSRSLAAFSYKDVLLLDYETFLTELLTIETLTRFIATNWHQLKYEVVRAILFDQNGTKRLPTNEPFRSEFISAAERYFGEIGEVQSDDTLSHFYSLFQYMEKDSFTLLKPGSNWMDSTIFRIAILAFYRQYEQAKERAKELTHEKSEYASAYETKKNIKVRHQERMANNAFLDCYGYVELDNDVELQDFTIIEENFKELLPNFPLPYRKDWSFRIKKLGRHKAAGVVFPSYKTIIFDLDHPESFVHEGFHQIDLIKEKKTDDLYYSETIAFQPIYDLYKDILNRRVAALSKDHPFRKEWESKNKYNKSYYLRPTEVFARAGEVYMSSLGLKPNSLFQEASELRGLTEYVFEEDFIALIQPFFAKLLEGVRQAA